MASVKTSDVIELMAEGVGAALAIPGLLNEGVTLFEHVQISRNHRTEVQTDAVLLQDYQMRLSRLSAQIAFSKKPLAELLGGSKNANTAKVTLQ